MAKLDQKFSKNSRSKFRSEYNDNDFYFQDESRKKKHRPVRQKNDVFELGEYQH